MRVQVKVGYVIPLGDYWTVRPEVGLEDEVREGETPQEAYSRLSATANYLFWQEVALQIVRADSAKSQGVPSFVTRFLEEAHAK